MKKRGISYVEVLVSLALFSVGAVPLLLSFNSSYDAINYNKDLSNALEYNQQMIEEIGSLLPLEIEKKSEGYLLTNDDIDEDESLEGDIRKLIAARSEDGSGVKKGIYTMLDWNESSFDFDSEKLETSRYYRKLTIGAVEGLYENGEGDEEITLPIIITTKKESDSSFGISSLLKVTLSDKSTVSGSTSALVDRWFEVDEDYLLEEDNVTHKDKTDKDEVYYFNLILAEANTLDRNGNGVEVVIESREGQIKQLLGAFIGVDGVFEEITSSETTEDGEKVTFTKTQEIDKDSEVTLRLVYEYGNINDMIGHYYIY